MGASRRTALPGQILPAALCRSKKVLVAAERYTVHLQAVKIEGGHRPPSLLHSKGFKRDGFLEHRARQVLRFDIPNEVPGH
jgi:hypothetical protein